MPDKDPLMKMLQSILSIEGNLRTLFSECGKRLDISGPQWMLLLVLEQQEGSGIPVKEIASAMSCDPSFVTSSARQLESQGLVSKSPSSTDARVVLIRLTDTGRIKLANLNRLRKAYRREVFRGVGDEEVSSLSDRLSIIAQRSEKASKRILIEAS
jgi:DNA-binding MarR family transcriptional regulator